MLLLARLSGRTESRRPGRLSSFRWFCRLEKNKIIRRQFEVYVVDKKFPVARSAKRLFNVALVENELKIRKYGVKLINRFPDFVCSCACATGEEALIAVPQAKPDVVLLDIHLPGMSGIACTRQLKKLCPNLQIVMFTAVEKRETVIRALAAGADGYLLKQTKPADLRSALLAVLQDGAPLTSQISRCVVESFRLQRNFKNESKRLSLTEERILMLLCKGYTNGRIAKQLHLSIHTIRGYLKRAFKKLGVNSRSQAAICYLTSKSPRLKPEPAHSLHQIDIVSKLPSDGRFYTQPILNMYL